MNLILKKMSDIDVFSFTFIFFLFACYGSLRPSANIPQRDFIIIHYTDMKIIIKIVNLQGFAALPGN